MFRPNKKAIISKFCEITYKKENIEYGYFTDL